MTDSTASAASPTSADTLVVLTGASRGLGRAIAEHYLEIGRASCRERVLFEV